MKFETLHGNRRKKVMIGLVVFIAIMLTLNLMGTKAKYRTTQSIPLVRSKLTYILGDVNMRGIFIEEDGEYKRVERIPDSGYEINKEMSYCQIGEEKQDLTIDYDMETKTLTISPLTKRKNICFVYFDKKKIPAKEQILANMPTQTTRSAFSSVLTTDTPGTIYKADDDNGTSYYFAGAASDNWVKFAGFYWRIIRINGDGTVRLIYEGTNTRTNNASSASTQLTNTSTYNGTYNDNTYVGYTNANGTTSSYANAHAGTNNSTIKGVLDAWYDNNLKANEKYIDTNAGFCNDRNTMAGVMSGYGTAGYGTQATSYAPWGRLFQNGSWLSNQNPTLKCGNKDRDLYTMNTATQGNKKLTRPIGLITSDEVVYAGGKGETNNTGYYLYTGQNYWTLSPCIFNASASLAGVFLVNTDGRLDYGYGVRGTLGVRPVINLKADTTFAEGGKGTTSLPYVVS